MYSNMCVYFNLFFVFVEFVFISTVRYTGFIYVRQKERRDGSRPMYASDGEERENARRMNKISGEKKEMLIQRTNPYSHFWVVFSLYYALF